MTEDKKKMCPACQERAKLIESLQTYISDAQHIAIIMKGDALLKNNMHAYTSSQGAIDILLDLQTILNGEKIPSLEEIKAEMNKAKEEQQDKGTPYMQ